MRTALSVSSFTVIILFGASMLPTIPSKAAYSDPEEARILSLEAAWNHAEQQKDVRALDLLLGETLSYVDYDGTFMDKAQFLASAREGGLHPAQITDESSIVHIYGRSAVVAGVYRERGTNKGKGYQRRGRFTDTWVRLGNGWQCVASQSTLIAAEP
jgi:ketosteroid isomerase-like protein